MNVELLKNAGIDYERGVKRFMGRMALYEKTLMKFLKDGTFLRIREAYDAGDADGLFAAVHEFKGMCGNIAMPGLFERADAMVNIMRGGSPSAEALSGAYELLSQQYETACAAITAAAEERL